MKGGERSQSHDWSWKLLGHLLVTVAGSSLQPSSWRPCCRRFFMDVWLSAISAQNRSTYACMSAPAAAAHDVPGAHSPFARFVSRHLKAHETSASRRPHPAGKHAQWRHSPSSRPVQPFETFREPLARKCSVLLLKQESLTQFPRPCRNVKSL